MWLEGILAAKSHEPAKRKAGAETALSDRLSAVDTRLAAIDARLVKDFPDYAALASPAIKGRDVNEGFARVHLRRRFALIGVW
jgi:hypothetical protein